jgi:molybdopterin-guanine dinucleotide biosynthesis protein A
MPFLSAALLQRLIEESTAHDVVTPESDSRRGLEPLCAFYSTSCRPAIERALERGDRHVISFYTDTRVRAIARDEVATFGDLDLLFLNVNSPEDRVRAETAARGSKEKEP